MDVNNGGIGKIGYPLISDLDKSIGRTYDVLLGTSSAMIETDEGLESTSMGGGVTLRGSFLIDEEGKVRHSIRNDLPLGRDIDEIIRLIDALDFHNSHGDVCPAGWQKGDEGMHPSDDGMRKYIAKNAKDL